MSETPEHREAINTAQRGLVSAALRLAVDALFKNAQETCWEVSLSLADAPEQLANISRPPTADALHAALLQMEGEDSAVPWFNRIAELNGFDLSLKSSGAKTQASMERKRRNVPGPVTDAVRLSFISSDLTILDESAVRMRELLDAQAGSTLSDPASELKCHSENWSMTGGGLLRKILKHRWHEFGAEVQFLPREQAQMAARITHPFYQVRRAYDELKSPGPTESHPDALTPDEKVVLKHEMVKRYMALAAIINELVSDGVMRDNDLSRINTAFSNLDESTQTYDAQGREGGTGLETKFSPIFKTLSELINFREYLRTHWNKIRDSKHESKGAGEFPLPYIKQDDSLDQIANAIAQMDTTSHITHACYMHKASDAMRQLWEEQATLLNMHTKDPARRIPLSVMRTAALSGNGIAPAANEQEPPTTKERGGAYVV